MRNWVPLSDVDELPRLPPAVQIIDSHCHLDFADFDADRTALLARAARAGVAAMITIGASPSPGASARAVELAGAHSEIYATVGVHPHDASAVTDAVLEQLANLARAPRVVGIGETGLDYHYDHSPRPAQQEAFCRFIALARQLKLPLVVHLRAADDDAAAILRQEGAGEIGGVIHCFSSDARAARAFLDLGFHLSYSGIVTFNRAGEVREAARITPADRLLVETDAPFLAPAPFRGRRNEPALVVQTAMALAEIRGEPIEKLAAATAANTRRLFRLP
jgi:TatD DNase family protein